MTRPFPTRSALLATAAALALALTPASPQRTRAQTAEPSRNPDRLVASGQATGFQGNFGNRADGNGDDGDLVRGRLADFAYAEALPPTTQAENVVVDRNTGLMWVRQLGVLSAGDNQGAHGNVRLDRALTWQEAIDAVGALNYAGHTDWRLPNLNELQSLVDFGRSAPALDPAAFPERFEDFPSPYFWSSTTNIRTPFEAFYVNFFDGHAYPWHKAILFSARPVRDLGPGDPEAVTDPVALLQTGQRTGFRGDLGQTGDNNQDDGHLRRGLAPDYAWADDGAIDTPAENLATDRNTDLVWLRDPRKLDGAGGPDGVGGNVNLSQAMDWQTAVERCGSLDYAGHSDWRLPNVRELVSITQPGRPGTSVDPAVFPNAPIAPGDPGIPWVWWSSTTAAVARPDQPAGSEAWYISTGAPIIRHHVGPEFQPPKARPGFARCVRDLATPTPHPLYRGEIRSSADFDAVTLAGSGAGIERVGKFILPVDPANPAAPFRAAFQDVNQHPLHYDFLRAAFPAEFGTLSFTEYTALVSPRATRRYFAGGFRSFTTATGARAYGFDVTLDSDSDPDLLTEAETTALYQRLARVFRRRPLVYSPTQPGAIARAAGWTRPGFPIDYPAIPPGADFEAYTTGDAYGTVRLMTLDDLTASEGNGLLSWQDIVVLDRAPTDLEGVVSGIVTGDRQGELSHLGVRAARRGTPNAYVKDSHAALAPYAGRLVRLTVTREGYSVKTEVTRAEAEAWWAARRPPPVAIPPLDAAFDRLDDLAQIGADDAGSRATTRVGAKAANLARLYTFLPARYQVTGFGIPFHPYTDFIAGTSVRDSRADPPIERSLADYIAALHADPRFATDAVYRAGLLEGLRDHFEKDGAIPDPAVHAIADRIGAIFGPTTMVRFRSSSNAEDGLAFNGAGLYDSTSVCAADSLDGDTVGPSRCDPGQKNERTIERGLRRVWGSLWNFRAWEERAYYGVDQVQAGMAILVTPAFPDERANGVAFSGNPLDPRAPEYLINAQDGDTSVVLPDPGVLPERSLLTVENGAVTRIRRVRPSSIVPPGTVVLSDAELRELGAVLALAAERFPLDLEGHDPADVMLDVEFKLRKGDDQLILKQIRPFLAAGDPAGGRSSALRLELPRALELCSMWRITDPIRQEYDDKTTLLLGAGEFTIPLEGSPAAPDIFGALRFGPDLAPANPLGPTELQIDPVDGQPERRLVHLTRRYEAGGRPITVSWPIADIRAGELNVRRVDEDFLTAGVTITSRATGDEASQYLAPCGLPHLAGERLEIALEGGQRAVLSLRKGSGGGFWAGYLWSELVRADVQLVGGRREVSDYGHLVYDALRHNWNESFWVLFDPPLGDAHGLAIRQQFLGGDEERFIAELLDANLDTLRPIEVLWVKRVQDGEGPGGRVFLPWGYAPGVR